MSSPGSVRLASPSGLVVQLNANGSIHRIDHRDVILNLFLGSELEGGPANLFLRRRGAPIAWIPLLGPRSPARVRLDETGLESAGDWNGLHFRVSLRLADSAPAWFWHVALENAGRAPETLDLVYAQDVALSDYGALRLNEYYVSQYVDHTPLAHPARGIMLAARQNLSIGGRHPWALLGSLARATSFATDALQLHGLSTRAGGAPAGLLAESLPGQRRQHEHSLAVLQDAPLTLRPGERTARGFFGWLEPDHPAASSAADLVFVDRALALPEATPPPERPAAGAAAAPGPPLAYGSLRADSPGPPLAGGSLRADSPGPPLAGGSLRADLPGPPLAGGSLRADLPGPPLACGSLRADLPAASLFSARPLLGALELELAELTALFGAERRAVERDGERLLSFFSGANAHVVLAAKERASLRPHGQILRTGSRLLPDEASLTTTVWMGGVFHSMLTQGHVSINRLLSTTHGYLGLFRAHGQRIFAELGGGWQLLDLPSAFEMTPSSARWLYKHADGLLEVRSWAPLDRHELWLALRVLAGPPCRFLVSHHVALDGDDGAAALPARFTRDAQGIALGLRPESELGRRFPAGGFRIDPAPGTLLEQVGGDELLFEDGRSRSQPFLVLRSAPGTSLGLCITGQLVDGAATDAAAGDVPAASAHSAGTPSAGPLSASWLGERAAADADAAERFWRDMTGPLALRAAAGGAAADELARLAEILPWFAHDALIHYLAPRGLEQYSGGGWGTRDVCQGPVELLLALGRFEPLRELLLRVFRNQDPDGDWPQWFMFFEREHSIRPADSHADIVFWPLLALAQYLLASDDAALLDEVLPFFHPEGDAHAEQATLLAHVTRALGSIARRLIPGTQLVAYGNGDWNDSLQPLDRSLALRLCSSWTVTLHYQSFAALAAALRRAGRSGPAAELETLLPRIRDDFQRLLVPDGVVAGLIHLREDGRSKPLLHPADRETGIRYSLLPMVHAILAGLFSPAQARHHLGLIRRFLLGADGARLFDRPLAYRGGPQRHFQRAESSSFFGREIGCMYIHAHLRYAEALAQLGDAEALLLALRQANPVGLREVLPSARLRQANCYSSSSDADFKDRYEASARYAEVRSGAVAVEGGWRVYSSGAGIALRLLRECLLGLRLHRSELGIDPVLPRAFDGLRATVELAGRPLAVVYRVGPLGHGPRALALNGAPLPFAQQANPYRRGGAVVALDALRERLRAEGNTLVVELS